MISSLWRKRLQKVAFMGAVASAVTVAQIIPASATNIPNLHIYDGASSCYSGEFCGWRDNNFQDGTSLVWLDTTSSLWSIGTRSNIDDFAKIKLDGDTQNAYWSSFNDRLSSYVNNTGQNVCLYTNATYQGSAYMAPAGARVSVINSSFNDNLSSLRLVGSQTTC